MDPAPLDGSALPDPGADPDAALRQRVYALGRALAYEQQRSAALERELQRRGSELTQLYTEVQNLRAESTELRAALEEVVAEIGRPGSPAVRFSMAAGTAGTGDGSAAGDAASANAVVVALRSELARARQRREEAEAELERLRQETSTPPYTDPVDESGSTVAADLATAKEEIVDLRRALSAGREERERLALEFAALRQRAASAAAGAASAATENAELRAQLERLQTEQQAAVDSFNRNLRASQERTAELERRLESARARAGDAAAADGNVESIRAENASLRSTLEVERRRIDELAAKLKVATRVTDLIFKMQAQQTGPAGAQ